MTAPARPAPPCSRVSCQALRRGLWASAAALLVAPAIVMRFTDQVDWTAADFAVAAALLFGPLAAYTLLVRRIASMRRRAAIGLLLCAGVGLLWVNGAVGIVGDEHRPANVAFDALALCLIAAAAGIGLRAPRG